MLRELPSFTPWARFTPQGGIEITLDGASCALPVYHGALVWHAQRNGWNFPV